MITAEAVSRMLVANAAKAVRQERVTVSAPPRMHPFAMRQSNDS